ncbi:hypothetical protein ACQR1Y_12450 [Bradyrhizobium sp. HKCCYLRH3099]|uniref:hypothetical protein n=1 Tax=Bradyrhizobium TaxID=374 RepID=UPI003EBDB18B
MCGGNKGQSQTSQASTYQPNPVAMGYITDALGRAQQTANLGFNVPQAPVAGFSGLQNQGFNAVQGAQGIANPYYQQASNLYQQAATPDVSQFFNPYAGAVTDQLKNIFGQQQAQTTGQLTQAAGGVGADRIAVGQANLANQQGLAAGQTLAGIYGQSLQAAQQQQQLLQGLGTNTAQLGTTAQNTALQGANSLLGAGNIQQQQSQAELNAPYQYQLAQSQFPYQQAQWYGNLVGALAPGLGGTTTGQGTATPAQPSVWSQVLGAGVAGAGALGQSGAFGSNGWLTGNNSYGGLSAGNAFNNSNMNSAYYGPLNSRGGVVKASGGAVDDEPIDITHDKLVPDSQVTPIKPVVPQLQQQSGGGGGGGGGLGDIIGAAAKIIPFFLSTGGAVNPFARGGEVSDEERQLGMDYLRQAFTDPTRQQGMSQLRDAMQNKYGVNPNDPIHEPDEASVQAWRNGTPLPSPVDDTTASASAAPVLASGASMPSGTAAAGAGDAAAQPAAAAPASREPGFIDSPWAALTAAGLGILGGTSPFAGVNIGQGGMKGLQMLQQQRENAQKDETTAQAAKRLELEAQHYNDQYTRMTPYQQQSLDLQRQKAEAAATKEKPLPSSLQKDLGEKATTSNQLRALETGFKPDYAGSGSATVGDIKNWAARQFNVGNTDAADWWQQYQAFQNKVRHELFGSALTATEAAQWERQSINPGMAPDRIKSNLARQREIVDNALRRRADSLKKQGYSAEGIDAEIGPMEKAQSFTGRTATNPKTGAKVRETTDGQWVPVQ